MMYVYVGTLVELELKNPVGLLRVELQFWKSL